jgi:hypothetical protein
MKDVPNKPTNFEIIREALVPLQSMQANISSPVYAEFLSRSVESLCNLVNLVELLRDYEMSNESIFGMIPADKLYPSTRVLWALFNKENPHLLFDDYDKDYLCSKRVLDLINLMQHGGLIEYRGVKDRVTIYEVTPQGLRTLLKSIYEYMAYDEGTYYEANVSEGGEGNV